MVYLRGPTDGRVLVPIITRLERYLSDRFALEKEQILSQYILHHDVGEHEVGELAERLDRVVAFAERLHAGQKRKSGEDYIYHPINTAMEVSRYGRIIDWASVEACILHDTIEDTEMTSQLLEAEFPDTVRLVEALTKIKDNQELTYHKLFTFVLQDIRVLLVKIADRLDNLRSLHVFPRHKQLRIAKESAQLYANICKRLCMTDLAERFDENIAEYLYKDAFNEFKQSQRKARETQARPLSQFRSRLAEIFPGDLTARIDIKWNRFDHELPTLPENLYTVCIITDTSEETYRAMGRVHMAFRTIPGDFTDTISNPRTNGFKALETSVSYRGRIIRFYITSRNADKFNRMGLLSMDIESPQFNLQYLDDLRDFLQDEDGDIQDFLRFQVPDAIQVTSPRGDVYSLEEGTSALDFAFAVHDGLGLRAKGARINDVEEHISTHLQSGDRVEIMTSDEPLSDERYLDWVHSRKALVALRRYFRKQEHSKAIITGQNWLDEAATATGIEIAEAHRLAEQLADSSGRELSNLYHDICMGTTEVTEILGLANVAKPRTMGTLVRKIRGAKATTRKVRRYEFEDLHIRFCPICAPVRGDDIVGNPGQGRLNVHRKGCSEQDGDTSLPLIWDRSRGTDLRDPGLVEMEIGVDEKPGTFYAVVAPFRSLGVELSTIGMPGKNNFLHLEFSPGTARTLDRLINSVRKLGAVSSIRVLRAASNSGTVPIRK